MTTSGTSSGDSSLNMSLSSGTAAQGVVVARKGQIRGCRRARSVGVQRRVTKRSTSVPRPRQDMPRGSGVQGSASYQQLNLQQVYHEAHNAEVVRAAALEVLGSQMRERATAVQATEQVG